MSNACTHKLRYAQPGGYDTARANPRYEGFNTMMPYGDYSHILRVRVRPMARPDIAKQTIAYITTRRRDGHRTLHICGIDGKLHRYAGSFPQCKHVKIPALAKLLGISREYEITLDRQRIDSRPVPFSEYQGKAKPHACRLRHK